MTGENQALGPATSRVRDLVDAAAHSAEDPSMQSRLPWRRRRARQRHDAWQELKEATRMRLLTPEKARPLVIESLQRMGYTAGQEPTPHPRLVRADIQWHTGVSVPVTDEDMALVLYEGRVCYVNRQDLRLVHEHKRRMSSEALTAISTGHSYATHPHEGKDPTYTVPPTEKVHALMEVIRGPQGRLERPVTVWRGEHANRCDPVFTSTARSAAPGDVLDRGDTVLSATMDPAVAAWSEWSDSSHYPRRRSKKSGWVLQITTQNAVWVADRAGGLAEEHEVLIHTPRLLVTGVFEGLARGRHGALMRVRVIQCRDIT